MPVSVHFPPDQNILTYSVVLYLSDSDSLSVCVFTLPLSSLSIRCACLFSCCCCCCLFPFSFFFCIVCGGTVLCVFSLFHSSFLPFRCLSCLPCLAHFSVMMMMIVFSSIFSLLHAINLISPVHFCFLYDSQMYTGCTMCAFGCIGSSSNSSNIW